MRMNFKKHLKAAVGIAATLIITLGITTTANAVGIYKNYAPSFGFLSNCDTVNAQTDQTGSFCDATDASNCGLIMMNGFCNGRIDLSTLQNAFRYNKLGNLFVINGFCVNSCPVSETQETTNASAVPSNSTAGNCAQETADSTETVNNTEESVVQAPPADSGTANDSQATEPNNNTSEAENTSNAQEDTSAGTSSNISNLNALEQQMVDLVNSERVKAGLSPLTVDLELARVARIKAQDMIDNNYFSHTSPVYGSPFQMMSSFGITYRTAGENIAYDQTVAHAHTALMNSQGHRENILNSSFTHIGIGIVQDGNGNIFISQMFIG